MTENIKLNIDDFAKKVGITLQDEGDLWSDADDFCSTAGYQKGKEFEDCMDKFADTIRESVVNASRNSFESVNLKLDYNNENKEVMISPVYDWEDSGQKITEIVDGYMGIMWSPDQTKYETLKEISDNENDRDLVKDHIHWIKNYGELYGTISSPKNLYYDMVDRQLRYHF